MTHCQVAFEGGEVPLVEDLAHEAHVLDDGDHLAVARRDPGRFLAAMLQRVECKKCEPGCIPARRENSGYPAHGACNPTLSTALTVA